MRYNFEDIGKRIKKERKAHGLKSQQDLCDYISEHCYYSYKRQTVASWECGKALPRLEVLLSLCELFECDLGYLLCEYDCKTRTNTDISKEIGLANEAIDKLRNLSPDHLAILNRLIVSNVFNGLLLHMGKYSNSAVTGKALRKERYLKIKKAEKNKDQETGAFNPPNGLDELDTQIAATENTSDIERLRINDCISLIIKNLEKHPIL